MIEARDLLSRWGISPPPRDRVHSFVRLKLLFSSDTGLKHVGLTLERLGKVRNDADYELSALGRRFQKAGPVEAALRDAGRAIAVLDQVDGDEARRSAAMASMPW